jgi:hypothetical protein
MAKDYDKGEQTQSRNSFTDQRIFEPPVLCIVRGRLCKAKALGNQEGHSPAYLIWDRGESRIESLEDVTIVDLDALAPTNDQVMDLFRSLNRR